MRSSYRPGIRTVFLAIVLLLASLSVGVSIASGAQAAESEGLECTTSSSNSFNLTATTGYVLTPDGNSIFMWGYAGSNGQFQLPGPTLCVPEGATVTVTLKNLLREPVSVVFPGQTGVTADGSPVQPIVDGSGNVTSLVKPASTGGTVTYTFVASRPGTFLYESGTDVAKQTQMGLFGALVVRPTSDQTPTGQVLNQAYDNPASAFDPQHEYMQLLSEVDPAFHMAIERNRPFDLSKLHARYFMINGRSMPDTISPNNAAWLPSQPYGAMIHIQAEPHPAPPNFKPALIRYLNAGLGTYPYHPHGNDQRVIGQDGYDLIASGSADESYNKFLIDIGPGQTIDTTLTWTNIDDYGPNAGETQIPVDLPALQDQIVTPDTWFSQSPYLGYSGSAPVTNTQNNVCGEYYHVAHSHALEQATNYGATFGGMMTLIRIDPPAGTGNCPAVN
jgi:FtsP/CotA-like multicopper oxidase with cupredoxin domain